MANKNTCLQTMGQIFNKRIKQKISRGSSNKSGIRKKFFFRILVMCFCFLFIYFRVRKLCIGKVKNIYNVMVNINFKMTF